VFEAIDISPIVSVRPHPLREPKFVLDVHLGRLARYLRLLGFDTAYGDSSEDRDLAAVSREQGRTLLTRDRGLLKRSAVTHGYFVRGRLPRRQIVEVMRRFDLVRNVTPFTRCLSCNGPLTPVAKADVLDRLPPLTAELHDTFWTCGRCGRVYWRGTHYERLQALVDDVLDRARR
jgi:uncharacterized protein with PIN domain